MAEALSASACGGVVPPQRRGRSRFDGWFVQFVDALSWLYPDDLLGAELACRGVFRLVAAHEVWRDLFWNLLRFRRQPPPLEYFSQPRGQQWAFVLRWYFRELEFAVAAAAFVTNCADFQDDGGRALPVYRSLCRTPTGPPVVCGKRLLPALAEANAVPYTPFAVSGYWRIPFEDMDGPMSLLDSRISCGSGTLMVLGMAVPPYRVVLQTVRGNAGEVDRIAVFVRCDGAAQATMTVAACPSAFVDPANHAAAVIATRSATRHLDHSEIGWGFDATALGLPSTEADFRVRVEVVVYPPEWWKATMLDVLAHVLSDSTGAWCTVTKAEVTHNIGQAVRALTNKQRHSVQARLMQPIMIWLEAQLGSLPMTDVQLVVALNACNAAWNLMDSHEFAFGVDVLDQVCRVVCRFAAVCMEIQDIERQRLGMQAAVGSLWNIPVCPEYRVALARQAHFFEAVLPQYIVSLPSADNALPSVHVLVALFGRRNEYAFSRSKTMCQALATGMRLLEESTLTLEQMGVLLSVRDLADFGIPLLSSPSTVCRRYAVWFISRFYFSPA